tara:strand:+ start:534 stop:917 length:384 start_codon:yes stop_codon:yes gene_type:complete
MKNNIFLKVSVKDGELHFPAKIQKTRFDSFLKDIPDDTKLEMFISFSTGKGSNAQLARLHAMIRELANDLGYTFEEVKLLIKRQTGLCFMRDKKEYCKSFADCDKEDLNLCIQECIRMGDFSGIQLR